MISTHFVNVGQKRKVFQHSQEKLKSLNLS